MGNQTSSTWHQRSFPPNSIGPHHPFPKNRIPHLYPILPNLPPHPPPRHILRLNKLIPQIRIQTPNHDPPPSILLNRSNPLPPLRTLHRLQKQQRFCWRLVLWHPPRCISPPRPNPSPKFRWRPLFIMERQYPIQKPRPWLFNRIKRIPRRWTLHRRTRRCNLK